MWFGAASGGSASEWLRAISGTGHMRGRATRVSCKSVPRECPEECPTRVPFKNVLQPCRTRRLTRVSRPVTLSYKSVAARVLQKTVLHEWPARVAHKIPQECPTRGACKSAPIQRMYQNDQASSLLLTGHWPVLFI